MYAAHPLYFEDSLGDVYVLAPRHERPTASVPVNEGPGSASACAALRQHLGKLVRFIHEQEPLAYFDAESRAREVLDGLARGTDRRYELWLAERRRHAMEHDHRPAYDLADVAGPPPAREPEPPAHWLSFDVLDEDSRPIQIAYRARATARPEREGQGRTVYRRWEGLDAGARGHVDLDLPVGPARTIDADFDPRGGVLFEVVDDEGFVVSTRYAATVDGAVATPAAASTPTRIQVPSPDACVCIDLEILPAGPTKKCPMTSASMNVIRIKRPPDGRIQGIELPLDTHTRIIIERPQAVVAQLAGTCFRPGGCLVLPLVPTSDREDPRDDALGVFAAILRFAEDTPGRTAVVCGHAGPGDPAPGVAAQRSENVHLYLAGDRAGWAAHCHEVAELADHKRVHQWAAQALGWPTDPGPIDDTATEVARSARDAFRKRCNAEFGLSLAVGVKECAADWEAVFDLYERVLAEALDVEVAELAGLRDAISFADPAAAGCGPAWPEVSPVEEPVPTIASTRVDVLLFEADDVPTDLGAQPPAAQFYDAPTYRRRFLPPLPTRTTPDPRKHATFIELHDVCFGRDRSLMVPAASTGERQSSRLLGALIVACRFVQEHADKLVLVAGHTDTTGSDAHNLELAEARAENVQLWLSGQRDAWAAHCQSSYQIADFKAVHCWAHEHLGWATDPGPIDESWHDKARVARDVFRTECEKLLGVELEHGVKQNEADWQAIHDLYALVVARYLEIDPEELAALREGIQFLDPPTLACGEHFPRERAGEDEVDSAANRRVELLFFDADEAPAPGGDGTDIYTGDAFTFEPLVPESLDPVSPAIFEIQIRVFDHWLQGPLADVDYTISGPVPECLFERSATTDGDGNLHETMLPSGHYELRIGTSRGLVMAHPVGFSDPASSQPGPKFPDVYRVRGQMPWPVFPPRRSALADDEWEVPAPGTFPDIHDDDVDTRHPADRHEAVDLDDEE